MPPPLLSRFPLLLCPQYARSFRLFTRSQRRTSSTDATRRTSEYVAHVASGESVRFIPGGSPLPVAMRNLFVMRRRYTTIPRKDMSYGNSWRERALNSVGLLAWEFLGNIPFTVCGTPLQSHICKQRAQYTPPLCTFWLSPKACSSI